MYSFTLLWCSRILSDCRRNCVFQLLNDGFERLDHGLPIHGAQRVQVLEVVGHPVLAVLVLFHKRLYLLQFRLQGLMLLAQGIARRLGSAGRFDSAYLVLDLCLEVRQVFGVLDEGRLLHLGALVARQEIRHMLQLGHAHRVDGVLQLLRVAAVDVHLFDNLDDGPARVAKMHFGRAGREIEYRFRRRLWAFRPYGTAR